MSLKLALIGSLATVSVVGLSTGGYFLLRGSGENNAQKETNVSGESRSPAPNQESKVPEIPGGQSGSEEQAASAAAAKAVK